MLIKIKTVQGEIIELDISVTDPISRVKQKIMEKEGIRPAQQKLFYLGHLLTGEKTVESYRIKSGDVLQLIVVLRGG